MTTKDDIESMGEQQSYSPALTQETKTAAIRQALNGQRRLMIRAPARVDISDAVAVEEAAENYVSDCARAGILPSVEGLCAILGFSRSWFYRFLREKPNSESAQYLDRLRLAWASIRIGLAERQVLSAPTTIFLLKNSGLGFSDLPADNGELPMPIQPDRPDWAYGMSEHEYITETRRRVDAVLQALPDAEDGDGEET